MMGIVEAPTRTRYENEILWLYECETCWIEKVSCPTAIQVVHSLNEKAVGIFELHSLMLYTSNLAASFCSLQALPSCPLLDQH